MDYKAHAGKGHISFTVIASESSTIIWHISALLNFVKSVTIVNGGVLTGGGRIEKMPCKELGVFSDFHESGT